MNVRLESTQAVWRLRLAGDAPDEEPLIDAKIAELSAALDDAEAAPDCRVIVLSGAPGCFCKGMDLRMLESSAPEELAAGVFAFADCLRRLRLSDKLIVAVVDGEASGGGVGLAAAADVLMATSRSTFSLPELVLGLVPAVVAPILLERMPPQKLRLLSLTGTIHARQAREQGLVDQVVDTPDMLESALTALVKRGLRTHPGALSELKRLTARVRGMPLAEALTAGVKCTVDRLADPEIVASVINFLDGHAPPWFAHDRQRAAETPGADA